MKTSIQQKLIDRLESQIDRQKILAIKLEDAIDELEIAQEPNLKEIHKLNLMWENADFAISELNDLADLLWEELDEEEQDEYDLLKNGYSLCGGGEYLY